MASRPAIAEETKEWKFDPPHLPAKAIAFAFRLAHVCFTS
jgi:hypothetical protein